MQSDFSAYCLISAKFHGWMYFSDALRNFCHCAWVYRKMNFSEASVIVNYILGGNLSDLNW